MSDDREHGYREGSDCLCGRSISTMRGLRVHLTRQRRGVGKPNYIVCDASSQQPGTTPYHIGYIEMVDGYRHAWTVISRSGRRTLLHGRAANHPPDPRCPECHPPAPTKGDEQ